MVIPMYQVDAFASKLFFGNSAAVVMLETVLDETLMQAIAMENNLSETAFMLPKKDGYEIRWFTPTIEVDLCGHATLAAAHVVLNYYQSNHGHTNFYSLKSGILRVDKTGDKLVLDFPVAEFSRCSAPENMLNALGISPLEVYKGKDDYMLVLASENDVMHVHPDFKALASIKTRGVIITAKGDKVDFVSRFFAPAAGIDEDPVTGSAHTMLIPYWAEQLKKKQLVAKQCSRRGGELSCELLNKRVKIGGKAKLYFKGEIYV